jgi:hypothetical protein
MLLLSFIAFDMQINLVSLLTTLACISNTGGLEMWGQNNIS